MGHVRCGVRLQGCTKIATFAFIATDGNTTCRDLCVKYLPSVPLPPSNPKVPIKVTLLYKALFSLNLSLKWQKLTQCDRNDSKYMLMECGSNQLTNFVDSFVRIY
jgi:hypothetical protein